MKVLLISNIFPNSAEPVRGIFTYQIVKALRKMCNIEVVAPLPWVPPSLKKKFLSQYPYANVPETERIGGIQVYHPRYLVIPRMLGSMHSIFMVPSLFRLAKKLERAQHFDLINAHWLFPDGVAAAWAGKLLRKPVILTGLGCDVNLYSTMFFRKAQIVRSLQNVAYGTVVSNSMKLRLVSLGIREEKIAVIPNGVDLKLFNIMDKKRARNFLKLSNESRIVLTIGSQDEVKGTKYLIEAFGMLLKRQKSPLLLILIGDGPLRKSLMSMSKNLGISKSVVFLGRRPHGEIPLWLNAADVFCLPSLREGQPNVVLEALACGIPVVASNVGAIPEMIRDNGRLSPPADSRSLCENLEFCLSNIWDREAFRRTVECFSWTECARMYFQSYLNVVNGNKASTE